MNLSSDHKLLVTGGAGFIGSHLCSKLLKMGCHVVCMDNLHTGCIRNIQGLLGNPRFFFMEHDVCIPYELSVDAIFNLACPASPIHYQSDPIYTMKTSFLGAMNALELAHKKNIPVLQASTSEVYGDPLIHPQTELYWGNVNPIGLRSCYDEGKRCAETLFFDFFRRYAVKIKVARIFNTYGPNMSVEDGRVVSNFIVQALTSNPITIYGNGLQTRSFCFVDDMVMGLIALMESNAICTGPINLGNPSEFTIKQLAEMILLLTKSSSLIVHRDLPTDDPRIRKPDISIAKNTLNWSPTVELSQGLDLTIRYFQSIL